jgi:hypothetical protein
MWWNMIKRSIVKYAKEPPHYEVEEYPLNCEPVDMMHLFDVDDDTHMVFLYQIQTEEQIRFFTEKGFNIDLEDGYFFVECFEE